MSTDSRLRTQRITLIAIVGVVVVGALVVLGVWLVNRDSRQDLSLAEIAKSAAQTGGYASEALAGLEEVTKGVCSGSEGCVEGYASPQVELLRFDTKERAATFASKTPGSHQSGWIVIEYRGTSLSDKGKSDVENFIDSMWTSD